LCVWDVLPTTYRMVSKVALWYDVLQKIFRPLMCSLVPCAMRTRSCRAPRWNWIGRLHIHLLVTSIAHHLQETNMSLIWCVILKHFPIFGVLLTSLHCDNKIMCDFKIRLGKLNSWSPINHINYTSHLQETNFASTSMLEHDITMDSIFSLSSSMWLD
jgi:hypothetical protein